MNRSAPCTTIDDNNLIWQSNAHWIVKQFCQMDHTTWNLDGQFFSMFFLLYLSAFSFVWKRSLSTTLRHEFILLILMPFFFTSSSFELRLLLKSKVKCNIIYIIQNVMMMAMLMMPKWYKSGQSVQAKPTYQPLLAFINKIWEWIGVVAVGFFFYFNFISSFIQNISHICTIQSIILLNRTRWNQDKFLTKIINSNRTKCAYFAFFSFTFF